MERNSLALGLVDITLGNRGIAFRALPCYLRVDEMGEDEPRHDFVVDILWTRMNIDAKCERSPVFSMQQR